MASELDTRIKDKIAALKAEKDRLKASTDAAIAAINANIQLLLDTNARLTPTTEADIAQLKSLGII